MANAARVTLRSARPRECQSLTELCLRSKAHWGYDAAFLEACRAELTIRPEELGDLLRVADLDGKPVGVVQLAGGEAEWNVEKLFVDPPFIGIGIGAVMMQWAVSTARAAGAKRLMIEADPDAAAFYRRVGAKDVGKAPSGSILGRFLPRLVLELY